MKLDGLLGHFHDFLRREQLGHVDENLGIRGILVDRLGGPVKERAHCLDPGCHVGKAQRYGLMLDQDTPTLHIVLNVVSGGFEGADANAKILRRLDDLSRPEIDAGGAQSVVLHQQMVVRHKHILEYHLAIVHETAAERLIAARDRKAFCFAGHQKT